MNLARDPADIPALLNPFQPTDTLRQIELESGDRQKLIRRLVPYRTSDSIDEFENMDTGNLRRLAQLSPMAQELVMRFYCERSDVRKPQASIGTTIRGLRDMLEQGLRYIEVVRFMQRAETTKLSYRPCTEYGRTGRCRDGDERNHLHVRGLTVHPRDAERGNYTPFKGKGKGKSKDLTDHDRAFMRGWYD